MKIAYLGAKGLPSKSGTERVLEAIVQRLSGRHEITVYCDFRYTPRGTDVAGIRLVRVPTLKGKHVQAPCLFILSALHALLFGKYDLVHVHAVEACFVLPLLKVKYRVIATAHGSTTRQSLGKWGPFARAMMGLMEYPFLFLPDCATSVSEVDAEHFASRYGKRPLYIPNGVGELPLSSPKEDAQVLSEVGLDSGKYLAFAAGRIDPIKGCHLLLEAFDRLQLSERLVIVGDLDQVPAYGKTLREMANERVIFLPTITSKKRLVSIVRHCSLFVFPSLTEAMSMMLLEAASLGVPLVCSDIPSNSTVLGDRAVYFVSGDASDLANKIRWALTDRRVAGDLANSAQEWVRQRFSWDQIAETYEEEYERLCRSRARRPDDTAASPPKGNAAA